jgi:hypothetical protein
VIVLNIVPRIVTGLELVDDEGDEVKVHRINESKGTVTLKTSEGESYSMALRELRGMLRDGQFACLTADVDDDDDDESVAEDEEDDEDEED